MDMITRLNYQSLILYSVGIGINIFISTYTYNPIDETIPRVIILIDLF